MFRAPIDSGYPDLTVIAEKGAVVTADGLAVDWVYNHVYWTDTGEQRLRLTDFMCMILRMMSRRFRDCCTPNSWVKGGELIYIYRTDNIYLYTYISGITSGPFSGGPSEVIPGANSFWNNGELGRSGAHRLQCPYMCQGLDDTNRGARVKHKGPECKD